MGFFPNWQSQFWERAPLPTDEQNKQKSYYGVLSLTTLTLVEQSLLSLLQKSSRNDTYCSPEQGNLILTILPRVFEFTHFKTNTKSIDIYYRIVHMLCPLKTNKISLSFQ